MDTQRFYADLTPLPQFLELADATVYVSAPSDWYVLITDITGSTEAIAAGQYREVNLMGASSIMAVLNAVHPVEIPFVFGGDGASLLVPPDCLERARQALLGVRALARKVFGLTLRVGAVPVSTVLQRSALKVAKFRLASHSHQASFMGGGITYATNLVKQDARYRLDVAGNLEQADLSGLECRWREISSLQGHTVSLIVAATTPNQSTNDVYRAVLKAIEQIFGRPEHYHPVTPAQLKLSFDPRKLRAEVNARSPHGQSGQRLLRWGQVLLENLLGTLFMALRLTVGGVNWGRYQQDVQIASDYQKIDDMLRMVIAGTPHQVERFSQYLEHRYRQGHLVYGLHVSDRALLTCLILDRRSCHFHLVDGGDGGYALAAEALKARLVNTPQVSPPAPQYAE